MTPWTPTGAMAINMASPFPIASPPTSPCSYRTSSAYSASPLSSVIEPPDLALIPSPKHLSLTRGPPTPRWPHPCPPWLHQVQRATRGSSTGPAFCRKSRKGHSTRTNLPQRRRHIPAHLLPLLLPPLYLIGNLAIRSRQGAAVSIFYSPLPASSFLAASISWISLTQAAALFATTFASLVQSAEIV